MSRFRSLVAASALAGLLAAAAVVPTALPAAVAAPAAVPSTTDQEPLVLRYGAPAPLNRWQEESLPIGNGAMGASIFGQVTNDEVFLNEKTLWTGGPGVPGYRNGNYPEAELPQRRANLQSVRDTIDANGSMSPGAAIALIGQPKLGYGSYQSFGKLAFAFDNGGTAFTDYERTLDLDRSLATVSYTVDGTTFTREYFASYPDDVVVMRVSADKPGKVSFSTTYDRKLQSGMAANDQALSTGTVTSAGGRITLNGTATNNGLRYNAQADIQATGGTTTANGATVTVTGADSATVVWAGGTDYAMRYPTYRSGEDPAPRITKVVDDAAEQGFDALQATHEADYRQLYDRVKLDLGGSPLTSMTNVARTNYRGTSTQDRTLETMFYQYGRYLLISSSRDGSLPANLQGVWNERNNPPWSADYHVNINLQMNYWPALSANLLETYGSYLDYIDDLSAAGADSAKNIFGYDDTWMVMNETTPYGFTGVYDWSTAAWFPEANAWLSQAYYWQYLYTGDEDFLRDEAYPFLRKTANFWKQYLVTDPRDGSLVANPSYSPEHGNFTAGAAMSQQLAVEVFQSTIEAAKILGVESEVADLEETLAKTDSGLDISPAGMIREWKDSDALGEPQHRHVSHLYALWPGRNISANTTPELAQAAEATLNNRGDAGTGWSMAWKVNFWAKLHDGDHSHKLLRNLLMNSTYPNLWDAHPPFQIDGNFGATSGINEMLVQNDPGLITVLPALPSAWADRGSFDGIKAWHDVTVGATWASGTPSEIRLEAGKAGELSVKTAMAATPLQVLDAAGTPVAHTVADGAVTFTAADGGSYRIRPLTTMTVASGPTSMAFSSDATVTVDLVGVPAGSMLVVEAADGFLVSPTRQWVPEGDSTASFTVRAPNTGSGSALKLRLVTPGFELTGTRQIALTDPSVLTIAGVAAWDSQEVTGESRPNGLASAAIDGSASTFWHTAWQNTGQTPAGSQPYPHYIVVDLGEERDVSRFTYLPRPKSDCASSGAPTCNGQIKGYELSAATAGTFVAPTAAQSVQASYPQPADAVWTLLRKGDFAAGGTDPQTITLDAPVKARYLKLTAVSPVTAGQAWASIGDLAVAMAPTAEPEPLPDVEAEPRIALSDTDVIAGDTITVTGGGFVGGEEVQITAGRAVVTTTADANGFISEELTIDERETSGNLTVTAAGSRSATADLSVSARPTPTPSATPTASPTPTKSPSAKPTPSTSPTAKPTAKPTQTPTAKPTTMPTAKPTTPKPNWAPSVPYTLPGHHVFNGRQWNTTCEKYSQTTRCRTDIWATTVVKTTTGYQVTQGWAFNNLTYLPLMTRAQWKGNPLGNTGTWTAADGRNWRTECDTATTGRGACRSYTLTTVNQATPKTGGGYTLRQSRQWVFDDLVLFKQ